MGFSGDNRIGIILALISSGFIGASFIIKKKGLRRAAAASGVRAGEFLFLIFLSQFWISFNGFFLESSGVGGYSYLLEPLWWLGMITSKFLCSVPFHCSYVLLV